MRLLQVMSLLMTDEERHTLHDEAVYAPTLIYNGSMHIGKARPSQNKQADKGTNLEKGQS